MLDLQKHITILDSINSQKNSPVEVFKRTVPIFNPRLQLFRPAKALKIHTNTTSRKFRPLFRAAGSARSSARSSTELGSARSSTDPERPGWVESERPGWVESERPGWVESERPGWVESTERRVGIPRQWRVWRWTRWCRSRESERFGL